MFYVLIVSIVIHSVMADTKQNQYEWYGPEVNINQSPSNEECVQRIYRECNYPTFFTDEELENVRQFLNYSLRVLADIKPDKPLCHKLHVRQDWKCLTPQQKTRVTNVWKKMYEKGHIQRLTDLHVKSWPAWHKSGEFLPSHRWLNNEFEKIMRSIDSKTTLPYWDPYTYGVQPELSSVWDVLGHSGSYSSGYSVPDGIYSKMELIPSIKRHWQPNGTILPWYTQEFATAIIQSSKSYRQILLGALGLHFPPHLNVGGFEGQYSAKEAPYDVLFYMHHTSNLDIALLKWQFQKKEFLTPLDYDGVTRFNPFNGRIQQANIRNDVLTGALWMRVKELFWLGFGDLCFIPDQLVKPINNFWKGVRDPIPTAAKRLPQWIIEKYFPVFLSGNYSGLLHTLEEVGECNSICHPIPKPTFVRETAQGKRQYEGYRIEGGVDSTSDIDLIETKLYEMWSDFTNGEYCSPYVTKY